MIISKEFPKLVLFLDYMQVVYYHHKNTTIFNNTHYIVYTLQVHIMELNVSKVLNYK